MKPEYSAEIKSMFLNGIKKSQIKYGTFDKFSAVRGFKLISAKVKAASHFKV